VIFYHLDSIINSKISKVIFLDDRSSCVKPLNNKYISIIRLHYLFNCYKLIIISIIQNDKIQNQNLYTLIWIIYNYFIINITNYYISKYIIIYFIIINIRSFIYLLSQKNFIKLISKVIIKLLQILTLFLIFFLVF
jgi:hypothetical protein